MTDNATPSAGWYPASHANGEQRYWDGQRWHDATPEQAAHAAVMQNSVPSPEAATAVLPMADESNGDLTTSRRPGLRWWAWTLIAVGAVIILFIGVGVASGRSGRGNSPSSDSSVAADASPSATTAAKTVTVPDTVNLVAKEARAVVENLGLEIEYSADKGVVLDQDNWTVVRSTPAAGSQIAVGSKVVLAVVKTVELEAAASPTAAPAPAAPSPSVQPAAPQYSLAQRNAIKSARSYLDYSAFSRTSLIAQLEFEKYSTEDATFAVDVVNPDWNKEAAESAKSYLEYSSFSRDELYGQLEYEGFTPEQIEFGLAAVGY